MPSAHAVAVVGGGPAGAFLASQLASAGRAVTLFDEKLAWEKPCGGGLTAKALRQYPFLQNAGGRRNSIRECELVSPSGRRLLLELDQPLAIVSRLELNAGLLDRARDAGATVVHERVVALRPGAQSWELELRSGATVPAAAVALAAGARNPLHAGGPPPLGPGDWMATAGYYLPLDLLPWPAHRIAIFFLHGLEGYIWSFPRTDHASVGICGKLGVPPTAELRAKLEATLTSLDIPFRGHRFYSHLLPAPSPTSLNAAWRGGAAPYPWALIGDAAGLVDPITGEGLYYALRSAELLARAWIENAPERYPELLSHEILPELRAAGEISARFYHGKFLGDAVLERMVQFGRRSPRFRRLLCDLFSGAQGYTDLRPRLYRNLAPTLWQLATAAS